MGYCIDFRDCDFTIKNDNKQMAMKSLRKLFKKCKSLSWVSEDDIKDKNTLEDMLSECRWDTENNENGDIERVRFNGEKSGDDEKIFEAIAPYVEKGSYVEMQGEEGEMWRWIFDGEHCKEVYPTISW